MPSTEVRRVVASQKPDQIVALTSGPMRAVFSNEAVVKVSAISLNRGELRRAERASDGTSQICWDFSGTVDKVAADGSGPKVGARVVGFSTRMEGWAEFVAVPTAYLAPVPDGVSDAQAATLPVAGLTALHSVDAATALLASLDARRHPIPPERLDSPCLPFATRRRAISALPPRRAPGPHPRTAARSRR